MYFLKSKAHPAEHGAGGGFFAKVRNAADASRKPRRDVWIIHWGKKSSGKKSRHYCLFVADETMDPNILPPHQDTKGAVFSWGSYGGGGHTCENLRKWGGECRKLEFDWKKEVKHENTYERIGMTEWSDDRIASAMNVNGSHYDLFFNNCRHVTRKSARDICQKSSRQRAGEIIQHLNDSLLGNVLSPRRVIHNILDI